MGRLVSQVLSSSRVNLRRLTNHLTTSLSNLLENTSTTIRESTATLNCNMPIPSACDLCYGCFGGRFMGGSRNRHVPEIIISENNILNHPITPDEITLSEEELEIKFQELVDELDLTTSNRNAMMSLPIEKKWQIYCSRRDEQPVLSYSPEYYIDRVKAFMPPESPKLFTSLKTSLRTEPNSFVTRFLGLGGLELLLVVLRNAENPQDGFITPNSGDSTSSAIIGCLKSLLNNSTGRAHVLAHENALNVISEQLASDDIKCKIDVLEILGAVCLVPGGHRRVLAAMSYFQDWAEERTRFQTIVSDLSSTIGPIKSSTTLKTAIMSFINAILSYGPGSESSEFRLHLRYELLMLGIGPTIEKLRKLDNATLDKHLDFFELMRSEDEKELARRLGTVHVDSTNTDSLFDAIKSRWCHGTAYTNLTSILMHLLNIKDETSWVLLDRLVQQLVLHPHEDRNVLDLNVDDIVKRLESELTVTSLTNQIENLTGENLLATNKLFETERELEISTQEKERLETLVCELQEKMSKMSYSIQNGNSYSQYSAGNADSFNLESKTSGQQNGNIPRQISPIESNVSSPFTLPHSTLKENGILPNSTVTRNSPVKPSTGGPPAPPPPPPPPMFQACSTPPQKPRPQPPTSSAPLKSFNWSKLPEAKLNGTLWQDIKEEYDALDLSEIDRLFSAYQKNWTDGKDPSQASASATETLCPFKKPTLSLIDSRRAQNCTILLSKLKMTDDEISRAILSMDRADQLHVDMVEQLMKFMPSTEERSLLEEQREEDLARADGFLLKISRIPHYSQRLFTLHYKKRFATITTDLNTKVTWVTVACGQLKQSRSLRKVLQIVLTLGNYMNRGQRGGAGGFKISSLTRLVDTKSNSTGRGNLMNYLVGELEKLRGADIEKEIEGVRGAAKVSLPSLEKDLTSLLSGINQIREEVEFQKTQPIVVGDRYLPVAREFLSMAAGKVDLIEKHFKQMKAEFSSTVSLFGEEYTEIDEFFIIFDQFLSAFLEAKSENEMLRKKKEEEGKKQATLRRPVKNQAAESPGNKETKTEFDDLISALRTGDVFSDLSDTRKRSRVKNSNKLSDTNSRERSH